MNADGTNARQVTKLATEASGVMFFPDGKRLLFLSEVYPDCTDEACNAQTLKEEQESKSKARIVYFPALPPLEPVGLEAAQPFDDDFG